jgi:hypothetical protein
VPVVLGRPLDFLLSLIDIAFFMMYCCHGMTAEASPTFPQPAHGTRNECHRPDPARSEPPRRPDARSHARAAELAPDGALSNFMSSKDEDVRSSKTG